MPPVRILSQILNLLRSTLLHDILGVYPKRSIFRLKVSSGPTLQRGHRTLRGSILAPPQAMIHCGSSVHFPRKEARSAGKMQDVCIRPVSGDEVGPLLRHKGSRQSTPLSTILTRYGNSVSTPGATRTGKCKQNPPQKRSQYGISVSTPHRRYGHRLRTPFLRTPFPRLLHTVES